MTKKRNEKYLKLDASGVWHLNFLVPARFGGKLIRQSLFTEDYDVAVSIRDRFVVPILVLNSGVAALEEIGKSIITVGGAKNPPPSKNASSDSCNAVKGELPVGERDPDGGRDRHETVLM